MPAASLETWKSEKFEPFHLIPYCMSHGKASEKIGYSSDFWSFGGGNGRSRQSGLCWYSQPPLYCRLRRRGGISRNFVTSYRREKHFLFLFGLLLLQVKLSDFFFLLLVRLFLYRASPKLALESNSQQTKGDVKSLRKSFTEEFTWLFCALNLRRNASLSTSLIYRIISTSRAAAELHRLKLNKLALILQTWCTLVSK